VINVRKFMFIGLMGGEDVGSGPISRNEPRGRRSDQQMLREMPIGTGEKRGALSTIGIAKEMEERAKDGAH